MLLKYWVFSGGEVSVFAASLLPIGAVKSGPWFAAGIVAAATPGALI